MSSHTSIYRRYSATNSEWRKVRCSFCCHFAASRPNSASIAVFLRRVHVYDVSIVEFELSAGQLFRDKRRKPTAFIKPAVPKVGPDQIESIYSALLLWYMQSILMM